MEDRKISIKSLLYGAIAVVAVAFCFFLVSIDSVLVPVEQAQYANTIIKNNDTVSYRAYVSGYRSSLDSIYFDISKQTIERTITITPKAKRWGLGVQLGAGAGYYDKKVIVSPYIGVGISYNIWRW